MVRVKIIILLWCPLAFFFFFLLCAGYSASIGDSTADLAMISGQILATTQQQPESNDTETVHLVIGLVVATVTMSLVIAALILMIICCRFHKTKR